VKTRAQDKIRLSSEQVLTLGEALDANLVKLKEIDNYPHKHPRYIARDTTGDLFWDVGQKLYESRQQRPSLKPLKQETRAVETDPFDLTATGYRPR
jgi:hypothetical protein